MNHMLGVAWLAAIGRSLREAFFMFWETPLGSCPRLRALRRGPGLRPEGVHAAGTRQSPPRSLARASGLGMVSSSCSYAATSLENALVGPLIAIVSWVRSFGNVPLAATLWRGGISFGGVIGFIFGDLIAMPLILIASWAPALGRTGPRG